MDPPLGKGQRTKIKTEETNNQIVQTYFETINKDTQQDGTAATVITVNGDEDGEAGGTYFVDEEGRYYFQPAGQSQNIVPLTQTVSDDTETNQDETNLLVEGSDEYQTVTLVPSVTGNGEVSYVLVVQDVEDKKAVVQVKDNENDNKEDNNMTVYDFDDNEEEFDREVEITADVKDDKTKIDKSVKKSKRTLPYFDCTYCTYTSSRRYLLVRHMKSHSEERPFKCAVCERGFKTMASLQNHVNTHNGVKPHICKYCKSPFTTSGELVRHVRYKHTHEKPHKCSECDYASVELSKLKRHVRCHTGERPYQCPHCTYASPDSFKLKRHLRTHTGEKPYVCEHCKMCFTQSNSLKAHKLIHNISAKPVYACELCPTTCGRKSDLRIHVQKLHTSEEPLKCKRCGKSFPDRYSHKLHNKTHEGEKCYKCDICPYASAVHRHLKSHMLKHTDEKPYTCDQCDQCFRQKQLLKRHQNLYHNPDYVPTPPKEKTHECRECKRQFAHKGNLIRHLAMHDPDSDIHERALALKLGRQKKIHFVNADPVRTEPDTEYIDDDDDDDDDPVSVSVPARNMKNESLVDSDGQQYVVLEVIQLDDGSEQQVAVVADSYGSNYQEADEDDESLQKYRYEDDDQKKGVKNIKIEHDVDACFGFDDEDAEEEEDELPQQMDYEEKVVLRLV